MGNADLIGFTSSTGQVSTAETFYYITQRLFYPPLSVLTARLECPALQTHETGGDFAGVVTHSFFPSPCDTLEGKASRSDVKPALLFRPVSLSHTSSSQ